VRITDDSLDDDGGDTADVSAAWRYHDHTKHSVTRLRASRHVLDWSIQPLPFKIYETLAPIPLPRELPPIPVPALDAIAAPGPAGERGGVLDLVSLARLLHYSAGVTRRRGSPGGEMLFRAAACTGALYHIDLYVICGALPDLDAGVYHFSPQDHALRRLRAGDHRPVLVAATAAEPATAAAAATVVCTSTFWRNSWKYQARAYRHCYWDCGTLLANLLAVASAQALPARIVLGFADAVLNGLLDLDADREVTLALVPLGRGPAVPARDMPVEPLGLQTAPLSAEEIDYPEIRRMHAASSLSGPDEVLAWRARAPAAPTPAESARAPARVPLPHAAHPALPIDQAVLRRSSVRRFARAPLSLPVLSAILGAAAGDVAADYAGGAAAGLGRLFLIVHAVDGVPSGSYVLDARRGDLARLREGSFRNEARHLALGQDLAGDASVDAFVLTRLEPVLERWGNRGYRAAQLEGGIIGGRLYLAAAACGVGATGLTFFDDDVTEFFSPHAEGASVMFLTALGIAARRRAD
jgi:SagB-type dehydrogenase family enzyme